MQFKRGIVDHWCDNQFRVYKETSAEYLLLDSGAQLHACPTKYIQDTKYSCLILESTLQEEFDSNMTEDDLSHTKLPEGRTIRVLFHACAVQKPILSLVSLRRLLE